VRAVDRGLKPTAIKAAPTGAGGVTRTLLRRPTPTRPLLDVLPDAIAPRAQPSLERRHLWERRYRRRLVATDAVCITAAAAADGGEPIEAKLAQSDGRGPWIRLFKDYASNQAVEFSEVRVESA
jgi:hypothetical protein